MACVSGSCDLWPTETEATLSAFWEPDRVPPIERVPRPSRCWASLENLLLGRIANVLKMSRESTAPVEGKPASSEIPSHHFLLTAKLNVPSLVRELCVRKISQEPFYLRLIPSKLPPHPALFCSWGYGWEARGQCSLKSLKFKWTDDGL